MSTYGILWPSFWSGPTGQQLQQCGRDTVILAAYLTANVHANMIGLYPLPVTTMAQDLPVLEGARAVDDALVWLDAVDFAYYDQASAYVWVVEMARFRLNLQPGQVCTNAARRIGAAKQFGLAAVNPFLGPFFRRYALQLQLSPRPTSPVGNHSGLGTHAAEEVTRGDLRSPQATSQERCVLRSTEVQNRTGTTGTGTHAPTSAVLPRSDVRANSPRARVLPGSIAFESQIGISVTAFLHREFLQRLANARGLDHATAHADLLTWYAEVERRHVGRAIVDDSYDFWRAQFKAWLHGRGRRTAMRTCASNSPLLDAVKARLEVKLTRHRYMEWVEPLQLLRQENDTLVVAADELTATWLSRHYASELAEACAEVAPPVQIRFEAAESQAGAR